MFSVLFICSFLEYRVSQKIAFRLSPVCLAASDLLIMSRQDQKQAAVRQKSESNFFGTPCGLYVIKIELFVSWLHIECHPSSHESITASSKHPIFLSPYTTRACRELQMFLQQARWREKKVLGKFHTAFFIRAFYLSKNITYVQCKK